MKVERVDLGSIRRAAERWPHDVPSVTGREFAALVAVVDAARALRGKLEDWESTPELDAALEPFTPRYDETSTLPTPGFNDDRAWEEVDRWNAERDLAVKAAVDATRGNPRDRARDQLAGQQPKRERVQPGAFQAVLDRDPRDHARDRLADAGVVVQRQFRSDQERIAELEAERDEWADRARGAEHNEGMTMSDVRSREERIAELEAHLVRVPALVDALQTFADRPNTEPAVGAARAALAEWEKP